MYSPNLAIIVVDDQESGRSFARSALSREGYEDIRLFADAIAALRSIEQRAADVIVSDWVMPGMDGLALTHRIRQRDEITNHYTAIILCTAQEGIEHLVEAFEQGVDDYLNKPYKERELTARVYAAGRTVSLHNTLLETIETLAKSNKQLEALSTTDPLTGLGNRRYLQTQLDAMLAETVSRGHPTCCAIIDLDHFKDINDRYGHDIGDEVLAGFATDASVRRHRICACLRERKVTLIVGATAPVSTRRPHQSAGAKVVKVITTTDHKTIGMLYLVTSFMFFLAAGAMALVMRAELAQPGHVDIAPALRASRPPDGALRRADVRDGPCAHRPHRVRGDRHCSTVRPSGVAAR